MLTPKFEIGQKVYAVSQTHDVKQVHVECDVCKSTGKVKISRVKGEYECPVCHGEIINKECGFKYVISYYEATIGKITVEEYSSKYINGYNYKNIIHYMLEETGVGSGQNWYEHQLFATEKEAQEFCEKYIPSGQYANCKPILKEIIKDDES